MQPEIEAKFLSVDHDVVRQKLQSLGAQLEKPMYLMRRTLFDYPDGRIRKALNGRLRVRNEGDKVTITFKTPRSDQYADEIETTVGSYGVMVELLTAIGLVSYSVQESKRETWRFKDVEVALDEWPWAKPFIEIEGKQEAAIRDCAARLGFDWAEAAFGPAETVYRVEYPGITDDDRIGDIGNVRFGDPLPDWLEKRRQL